MKHPYIAVMGTMGSGKSTVAKILAECLSAELLVERFAENPFLEKCYSDMKRYAFASQTTFLVEKLTQMQQTVDLLQKHTVVQDTPVVQDVYSYARAHVEKGNISPEEWQLYIKIYELAIRDLPKPDLILYLEADVDTLRDRILKRGRSFEAEIDMDYLKLLDRLNHDWVTKHKSKQLVLHVDTTVKNVIVSKKDRNEVVREVKSLLPQKLN